MSNLPEQINEMQNVADRFIMGKNPTEIARELNITRGKVMGHIESWKNFARHELNIADRAKETLAQADEHYNKLIQEGWEVLNAAKNSGENKEWTAAINLIHSIEKTRVNLYAAAGINADDALAQEMLETQRKQEIIIGILKNLCPSCKKKVASELSEVTGKTTEIVTVVEHG